MIYRSGFFLEKKNYFVGDDLMSINKKKKKLQHEGVEKNL